MINPVDPKHRQRLARAVDHSYQELRRYSKMRSNTIQAYLGISPHGGDWDWSQLNYQMYKNSLPKGNLLQLAGLSLQVALAYGEPKFQCTARVPEHKGMARKMTAALNRMSALLNLGETARNIAADSYFGYGIYKVGVGRLPLSARVATGLEIGPCVWRVSQDDFIYDTAAQNWDNCSFMGDLYMMPLNEAQEQFPEHADRLANLTDVDRLDSPHVLPRPSRMTAPEEQVWLVDIYFPTAGVVATWPVRNESFGEIAEEPIAIRDYNGHWSGIYQVLNHLYSPDELVPVAQAESVKSIHFLFNDILHLTSEQAKNAKINPMYQAGGDRDMRRLWDAADRHPVSVTDLNNFGLFEIPGPSQSQTTYLAALANFFDKFNPTLDEPQRAPTATQGALERQTTNATVAEAKRKFNRVLQLVGYKLGHLLVNDNEIILPAHEPLRPGSSLTVDMTFRPEPRVAQIDDFDIWIEPHSTIFRPPEEKLAMLQNLSQQVVMAMQLQAQGAPINVEKVIDTLAEYSGLPELRDWFEEADPMHQAKGRSSEASVPRVGVGQYVRENVSTKTNAGALEANLQGVGSENGQMPRVE